MRDELEQLTEKYNVICIMEFGSQLYGTATPNSDTDYKGIFLPTKEQILLQKIPKHIKADSKTTKEEGVKNTKDDVDIELYSLNYFIDLCLKGETIGIDMLHCPDDKIVYANPDEYTQNIWWLGIRQNREKFYTNNLKGFVGYCRKQAAKYGIKGSRISDARRVLNFLEKSLKNYNVLNNDWYSSPPIGSYWGELPKGEHIYFVKGGKKDSEEEFYQVCGKKLQKTSKIPYCVDILERFISQYGHRALLAEKNEGLDWKAISHAMRYGLQIKELFETGDIKMPLEDADYLRKIKKGELNYLQDVAPVLESLMDVIEELNKKTSLPSKPNYKFWEEYLINIYGGITNDTE